MLYLNFLFFFSCRSLPCMTLLDATSIWRKTKFLTLKMVSSKSFYLLFIEGYEHNCIWWKILNMLSSTVTFFLLCVFFFFLMFLKAMTWVWLLKSLKTWKIRRSLFPAFSRYRHIKHRRNHKYTLAIYLSSCLSQNAELKFNFGGEDFKHPPQNGFVALDKAPDGHTVKSSHTGVTLFFLFCFFLSFRG